MFSQQWKTSARNLEPIHEKDVMVKMSDDVNLCADIFRPKSDEKFPVIIGYHPYTPYQTRPIKPASAGIFTVLERQNGPLEAGDPIFFARRGYVHIICNVRGTGKSEGKFQYVGPREIQDGHELVEWAARQPWSNGKVGMFGVSYLARVQFYIAATNPPSLKCLFAPWGSTDQYRDAFYQGGILSAGWLLNWTKFPLTDGNARPECHTLRELGEAKFREAVAGALNDENIASVPELVSALKNPFDGVNPMIVDILLHPNYDSYWKERTLDYTKIKTPAYVGGDWGIYGLHLPAAFRSWENLNVPKKMIISHPAYLDRPVYQLHFEALRWFDYWLKGMDTGIMDEPPIRLYIPNTGDWKEAKQWPLAETKWWPIYLHEEGLLSEHEHWPHEGSDSFQDSPYGRGSVVYQSPTLVETTEIIGPLVLNLFASTTDDDVFWVVSFFQVDAEGNERTLTKGWLRGAHMQIDRERSKDWLPYFPCENSTPLTPDQIYEFNIPLVPTGNLLRIGYRFGVKISCADDPPKLPNERTATGHLRRQSPSRLTIYHDSDHPSCLLLPVTRGNLLGTFISRFASAKEKQAK